MAVSQVPLAIRESTVEDLTAIRVIYNEGIADRLATLDEDLKSERDIAEWYAQRSDGRYGVLVAERDRRVVGWASLNPYSHRCAYRGVADLSIYVARDARGTGVGSVLLDAAEVRARTGDFHKIVLFALAENAAGRALYRKLGYRDVGTLTDQGRLDGRFVDVIVMEKLLRPLE